MAGYWNRPAETAEMIRDGWLYTGDLARIDEDGFTTICGRKKDLIIVSGFNVYPDEVDRVLFTHPQVLEAATIGVPDERRGERIKSFVVLRPGATATAEDILGHCRRELAPYKVPRDVAFLSELPKSAMLKILRRELRAQELRRPPQPVG
jgi:long-chain acyl-CoA synthetase